MTAKKLQNQFMQTSWKRLVLTVEVVLDNVIKICISKKRNITWLFRLCIRNDCIIFLTVCQNTQLLWILPGCSIKNTTVECVWLIAGLQPHLAWVWLIRLWGRVRLHSCGAWTIMAPKINQLSTHILRREPLSWQHVTSAQRITSLLLQKMHSQH